MYRTVTTHLRTCVTSSFWRLEQAITMTAPNRNYDV